MFALQYTEYGGPEVLRLGEAPEPHAGPGEIRIVVRAASVNPMDWKIRSGMLAEGKPLEGTGYLGFDASGVVDEVGVRVGSTRAISVPSLMPSMTTRLSLRWTIFTSFIVNPSPSRM